MSKAFVCQHDEAFGPGRLVSVFRDFGIPVELRRLDQGDEPPTDLDEVRVLVSLGGPQRAHDLSAHPLIEQELKSLETLVEQDRPVLGIGLGAQLLALAAGAKTSENLTGKPDDAPETRKPAPQFGWAGVKYPFPGGTEPINFGMVDGAPMFHWRLDTLDLPKLPAPPPDPAKKGPPPPTGNALLASTAVTRNAAFRFKTRLFGFQYHFEFTGEEIEKVLARHGKIADDTAGAGTTDAVRAQTEKLYPRYARLGERVLVNYVQFLKAY